jgi:glycosyltransferase involved in cell wall biosynthesis
MKKKTPLLYALHSGELYGMERMALATAWGLRGDFEPVIFCPPGPAASEARQLGFTVVETVGIVSLSFQLLRYLSRHRRFAFFATSTTHSLFLVALNIMFRRQVAHVHMVHGFHETRRGFATRRLLNRLPISIVTVSDFVKHKLVASGVRREQIRVIGNFLSAERVASSPRREAFVVPGIRRAAIVSRIVPLKRIDLLLTCLEARPELNSIAFHIYGSGSETDALKKRALRNCLNIVFEGFCLDIAEQLAKADLLIHLCPDEAFGIVILEAMAAGVPVVVPDRGGSRFLIDDGISGSLFVADDAESLADVLSELRNASADRLNMLAANARATLDRRFSECERLADYRSVLSAAFPRASR